MLKLIRYVSYVITFLAIVALFCGAGASLLGALFACSKVAVAGIPVFLVSGVILCLSVPFLTVGE